LNRSSVRVAAAGGTGGGGGTQQQKNLREWLAPIIRDDALPRLLGELLPGFDLSAVAWQPVHPRAFRRAIRPILLVLTVFAIGSAPFINLFSALEPLLSVFAMLLFTRAQARPASRLGGDGRGGAGADRLAVAPCHPRARQQDPGGDVASVTV
jgi:uncharacterized membrane protein YdbT with pleckstrin-like domain